MLERQLELDFMKEGPSLEEKQKILILFIKECLNGASRIVESKGLDGPSESQFFDYLNDCRRLHEFGKRRGYLNSDEYERILKEWVGIRKRFYMQKSEKEFYSHFASKEEVDKLLKKVFG